MSEPLPAEGTMEYVEYLLDGLEAEIRLSERYDIALDSVDFYRGMLRSAYQQRREHIEAERTVVVEVLGGVAYVVSSPDDIAVEIIDHDNAETSAFDGFLERADMPQAGDARVNEA